MSDSLLSWFDSYLSNRNRTQQVRLNAFLPDLFPAHSGVPQGGLIFFLLFAIFIME